MKSLDFESKPLFYLGHVPPELDESDKLQRESPYRTRKGQDGTSCIKVPEIVKTVDKSNLIWDI